MKSQNELTVTVGAVQYSILPLDTCLDFALNLTREGKHWHSHVLSPGCLHNPYEGKFAIVIENDSDRRAYIASSDSFPEVDKDLVKLLHGDDILDELQTTAQAGRPPVVSPMLDRLRSINDRSVPWHHHMNFPDCVFNPQPGSWAITIESAEGDFFESYPNEPTEVLREVEVLYFARLESGESPK